METTDSPTEPQATFYGGIWAGLVPLGVFLCLVLGLVILGAPTTEGMIVAAMIGVTAGMFFARDYGVYCERVFSLMANRVATVAIVCWLWAGMKMVGEKYQMPPTDFKRLLESRDDIDYFDPLAQTDDGKAYAGEWIAAMQPVRVPRREVELQRQEAEADLLVLVQYRLEKVMQPVKEMTSDLLFSGAAALGSILIVTFTLWWLVRRANRAGTDRDKEPQTDQELIETIEAS